MKPIIIAIDGYSSCGKSTLAKALAKRLSFAYLDTGAMYRAVTLFGLKNGIDYSHLNSEEIAKTLEQVKITFHLNAETGENETFLNGENVEAEIRGKAVSEAVSQVAQIKAIREHMVKLQQKAGKDKNIVVDGRDIGTKVFPNAELKLFMTADKKVRAKRRYDELKAKGLKVKFEDIEENLKKRDYDDTHRKENPLRKAEDAVELDNSSIDREEQLSFVIRLMNEKFD
ncbi:MAG: (d)CMP kinase [Vicingaceae bacterium]